MFLDELTPLLRELLNQPIAFLGGVAAGALKLDLAEDPVKSWLEEQGAVKVTPTASSASSHSNGSGPKTIEID